MTNREKFKEIWGNGTVLENISCEAQHGIHDPRYQACIAFERWS